MKKGMAGQKWGPDVMAHPAEEFSESSERGKFCQHAWRAYWQCGGVLPKGDLNPSEAYGENIMDLQSISFRMGREILPDIQTNARRKRFLGTKRLVESAERSDHPAATMANKRRLGAFGPPSTMEGDPRRTRRLRHGLSTEHGTPVFQYLQELGSREILPPDVLRRSESSRRQTAEGGGHMLPWAFANTLRLSNERLLRWCFPLSLI